VVVAPGQVSVVLKELEIRIRTMPEVYQRASGFREVVESLLRLEPDVWVEDYILDTKREAYRIFLTAEPAAIVGVYRMEEADPDRVRSQGSGPTVVCEHP
jgi:hypothetical protein